MSRKFQVKAVPSTSIEKQGHRLDCGPYMSGAMEARAIIEKHPNEHLQCLTQGGMTGLVNAGRITRLWVDDPGHGFRFLTSSSILDADLDNVSLIAKSVARSNPSLLIEKNWTLITRSGTIGRMAYSTDVTHALACSEDVLRVIPDSNRVKPGYLFAYLSSKFGVPLVVSGTYGSIITHLEPGHISELLVPRIGPVEEEAHALIESSAKAHSESVVLRKQAGHLVNEICDFPEKLAVSARVFAYSQAASTQVLKRLDATFHNPIAQEAEALTNAANGISLTAAGVSGFESNRLKQIFVEEGYGTPFITSGGVFSKTITPERYLRNQLLGEDESWRINEYDNLIARSGQVGGIIGRGVWADSRLDGFAASPHILRLRPTNQDFPPGYVYAFLCLTDVGYQLLARTAAGSSIPFLPLDDVLEIKIPTKPSLRQRQEIDALVKRSGELRKQSQELEMQSVALVESAIAGGAR
jgi:type I restriction enzyme S subunit